MNDTPDTPTVQAESRIREELEKAASLISGARRLMGEGRSVDLGALEERMRAVTTAIRNAPEDVAHPYKDHLQALMAALDALEDDLNRQHRSLESGLDTIRRREAQGAYGAQPSPQPAQDTPTPPSDNPDETGE